MDMYRVGLDAEWARVGRDDGGVLEDLSVFARVGEAGVERGGSDVISAAATASGISVTVVSWREGPSDVVGRTGSS